MKNTRSPHEVALHLFRTIFPASVLGKMLTGGAQHPPMFVLETDSGKMESQQMDEVFDGVEEAMLFHTFVAAQPNVRASAFINEVYSVTLRDDDPRLAQIKAGTLKPEDLEEAEEAILYDIRVSSRRFVVECKIVNGLPVEGKMVEDGVDGAIGHVDVVAPPASGGNSQGATGAAA